MSYVWLITGASSGLGTSIALAALKAGHKVVAGARSPDKARAAHPEVEQQGGSWLQLDVTAEDVEQTVAAAVKHHGINVLINNAGYAERGVLEAKSIADVRKQFDTNFYGALAVTKGVIPAFREKKDGYIGFISSTAGMRGFPGYSLYCGSKWALEGAAESIAVELAPFGVRVKIFQPGAYRTQFQVAASTHGATVPAAYKGTPADDVLTRIGGAHGKQPGDPDKAAVIMVDSVAGTGSAKDSEGVQRVPLGNDAVDVLTAKASQLQEVVDKVGYIGRGAVF